MSTIRRPAEWLSLEDIAEDLGVPVASLYQWRTKRTGPVGVKVGRHVRVRRSEYERWLATRADGDRGDAA